MTNTKFIRRAALKQGVAQAPRREVEYSDFEYQKVDDGVCWLCGGKTDGAGKPTSEAIKKTFTDHHYAKAPESNSLCRSCYFCLYYKNRSLRNYSILATKDSLRHPGRDGWRNILFNPPEPPFIAILSVSGQKHLHFKSEIAQDTDNYPILLEEREVIINQEKLLEITESIENLYSTFTKSAIRERNYKQSRIMEFGLSEWERLEEKISSYRQSGLFEVALFIAQKEG